MSEQIVLRGVVLQEAEFGDGNKILTIFSKDYGKVAVRANGAKKVNSKLLAATQPFTYCDYVVNKKNNFYYLNDAEIIKSFYKVTEDYEALCCALACVEIINKNIQENYEANEELLLLIYSFKAFANASQPKFLFSLFIMKFMQNLGLEPYLEDCCMCQEELEEFYFSFEGLICNECRVDEDVIKINQNIVDCFYEIFSTETKDLYKIEQKLNTQEIERFYKVATWYLKQHTDITYVTLNSIG